MSENFDLQAAWLRRFSADAASHLGAFAHRLAEALPGQVTIHEKKGMFARSGTVTGVTLELGESRYKLEIVNGHLVASIAMVVRGITLNTKTIDAAEWFARLRAETEKASAHAQALSASLQAFMVS
ncbi:hypothetical protein [Acidocella facilis]|uniref:hypothetical protein n=1 Tax=Acidocella facilis TaxID=525 RepID=UPI00068AECDB|nr:hypothetical protein [Acidocella facilis]